MNYWTSNANLCDGSFCFVWASSWSAAWKLVLKTVSSPRGRPDHHPLRLHKYLMQPTRSPPEYPCNLVSEESVSVKKVQGKRRWITTCKTHAASALRGYWLESCEQEINLQHVETSPAIDSFTWVFDYFVRFHTKSLWCHYWFKRHSGIEKVDDATPWTQLRISRACEWICHVIVMLIVGTFNFTTCLNIKARFQHKPLDRSRPSIKCRQPRGKVRERHILCQTDPRGNAAWQRSLTSSTEEKFQQKLLFR